MCDQCDQISVTQDQCDARYLNFCDNEKEAKEMLKNIPVYPQLELLVLENCNLVDEDLELVPCAAHSIKWLSLRLNNLSNPWRSLAEKFPNLIHLDIQSNPLLNFSADLAVITERLSSCKKFDIGWPDGWEKWDESKLNFIGRYCPEVLRVNGHKVAVTSEGCTVVDEESDVGDESEEDNSTEWSNQDDSTSSEEEFFVHNREDPSFEDLDPLYRILG